MRSWPRPAWQTAAFGRRSYALALGLGLALGACTRAKDPPLPSFSRAKRSERKEAIEKRHSSYLAVDRCIDAGEHDLSDAQYHERARLLCRQAGLSIRYDFPDKDPDAVALLKALSLLAGALDPSPNPKIEGALSNLRHQLDRLHDRDDPKLLALLRGRDAPWRAEGIALRLAIRRWRRCQERSSSAEANCKAEQQLSRIALHRFAQGLAKLPGEHPFATRSFRRCAERSFLPKTAETESLALLAPSSPEALRSCERMAARIPWDPL